MIDYEIAALLNAEIVRQARTLSMIASENIVSDDVLDALQSAVTNKTVEGTPDRRYHAGSEIVDELERLTARRACSLFGASHANVQCHSGTQANQAALKALARPGSKLLSMSLAHGGHLSHGHNASATGHLFRIAEYGVHPETGLLDMNHVRRRAVEVRPAIILAGASAYPRNIDWAGFADIAREVDALLLVDIAHFAGLVAARLLQSPMVYADVVTMSTYKSLRGPRGGILLASNRINPSACDHAVFPFAQGTPALNAVAAKAVCLREATQLEFRIDCQNALSAAHIMSERLLDSGISLITGGTDTTMLLVDLRRSEQDGECVTRRLAEVGLLVNRNPVPGDLRKTDQTSGVRLSTMRLASRGLPPAEIAALASVITDCVRGELGEELKKRHKSHVRELTEAFPLSERGTRRAV